MKKLAIAITIIMMTIGHASATPGGLDASGCHVSKKGVHHCHDGKKVLGQATRADCRVMPNDGWCTKYRKVKPEKTAR